MDFEGPHDSIHTRRRLLAGGAAGAGALGAGLLAARPAHAQLGPPDDRYVFRTRVPFNVKDFGAEGDGSTDDTAAIQAALDEGPGGAVFLPPGRYSITGIVIPSDTELFGAGWSSQLVIRSTPLFYPLKIPAGAHDVHLYDFSVDGNKAAIGSAHPTWNPDTLNGGPACILIADGATNTCRRIYVDRLRVFDSFRLGIVFQSVVDGAVRDCSVQENHRDGITLYYNTANVAIRGNTIIGCADDHIGINSENEFPYGHLCESIVVTDNTMLGPSPRGKGRGMTVRGGKDILIANNVFRDLSQSAIVLNDFETTPVTDTVIANNVIYRPGQGGSHDKLGISVYNAKSHIRRLNIVGNMIRGTGHVAIRLWDVKATRVDDDICDVLIADNAIEDSPQEGIGIGSSGINDVMIQGNRIKGSAADGIVSMGGAKRLHIKDNVVYRGGGYGIRLSIADSGSLEGNQVFDDRGSSATQTYGIMLNALKGVWAFRDNTVWGHVNADYDLHQGSHTAAKFDGPYRVLFGTTGWNPPPLPDGAATTTTVPVVGAQVGNPCTVGLSVQIDPGMLLSAYVKEPGTVAVTLMNKSGSLKDIAGGTVWVHAEKPPPLP
jgi:hypothetical protein